jgi:hypothetical protein
MEAVIEAEADVMEHPVSRHACSTRAPMPIVGDGVVAYDAAREHEAHRDRPARHARESDRVDYAGSFGSFVGSFVGSLRAR